MKNTFLVILLTGLALVLLVTAVGFFWAQTGVKLSLHAWVAYGLGCTASFALAGGLFFLTFKSSRDGYDDIPRPEELGE